jgi:cell division septum initiation protein DivIVA
MDSEILALIDALEELLSAGGRVPLSSRVMVPAPEAYHLLDQMRQTLPREIIRARHIFQDRDRLLQEAQNDADALRASARAERETVLSEHAITLEATASAEAMLAEARRECDRMRDEADRYALESLRDLHALLLRVRDEAEATLKTTRGGIMLLNDRAADVEDRDQYAREGQSQR